MYLSVLLWPLHYQQATHANIPNPVFMHLLHQILRSILLIVQHPPHTTPATSLSTNTAHVVTRDHSDASEIGDIREKKRFHIQLDSDEDSGEESVVRQVRYLWQVYFLL